MQALRLGEILGVLVDQYTSPLYAGYAQLRRHEGGHLATNYEAAQAFLTSYSRKRAALNVADADRMAQGLPETGAKARTELAEMLDEAQVYALLALTDALERHVTQQAEIWGRERPARTGSGEMLPVDRGEIRDLIAADERLVRNCLDKFVGDTDSDAHNALRRLVEEARL